MMQSKTRFLTFQLCPSHTVPKSKAPIATARTESTLAFVESDSVDGEDILGT